MKIENQMQLYLIIGHSVGEISCGYADGCLTAREAILVAYWRGRAVELADIKDGAMAAIGNLYYNSTIYMKKKLLQTA